MARRGHGITIISRFLKSAGPLSKREPPRKADRISDITNVSQGVLPLTYVGLSGLEREEAGGECGAGGFHTPFPAALYARTL